MQRFSILTVVILMLGAMGVDAATLIVRQDPTTTPDYTTVEEAVRSADAGDTVMIDDSAIYTEVTYVYFTKAVRLIASAGETPTIANSQGGNYTLWVSETGGGSQIGSMDGGTITLDGLNTAQSTIWCQHAAPTTVRIENVHTIRPGRAIGGHSMYVSANASLVGNIELSDVLMDRSGAGKIAVKIEQVADASVLDFRRLSITNPQTGGDGGNGPAFAIDSSTLAPFSEGGTLNLRECFVDSTDSCIYLFSQPSNRRPDWTLNISDSCLRSSMSPVHSHGIINFQPTNLTITNSAFVTGMACIRSEGAPTTNAEDSGSVITLDHCDLITTPLVNHSVIALGSNTGRELHLSNTNLINEFTPNGAANVVIGAGSTDTLSANNNNLIGDNPTYVNFTPPSVNDVNPPIPPGYDTTTCDFTYSDETLLVSDENGEPVGTNQILPPVEMDVQAWQLY